MASIGRLVFSANCLKRDHLEGFLSILVYNRLLSALREILCFLSNTGDLVLPLKLKFGLFGGFPLPLLTKGVSWLLL